MSVITDLLILTAYDEAAAIDRVNAWCEGNDDRKQTFTRVSFEAAGGWKVFTPRVWAMAANHFPYVDLVEVFPTFGWRWPNGVVLLVQYEHHDGEVLAFRADGKRIASSWVWEVSS